MPTNRIVTPDVAETDAPMFAPIPSWERNRNRRGFGGARRTETVAAGAVDAAEHGEISDPAFAAPPTYATSAARRNSSAAPIAIAAGVLALGGLVAAGWYAAQPHEVGMAQLTPGVTSTTTTTTAVTASSSDSSAATRTPESRASSGSKVA